MAVKRIAILGATGSIGRSALDIISRDKEKFKVVLLCARTNRAELEKLSKQYPGAACALTEGIPLTDKARKSGGNLLSIIAELKPDITINGISGAAGLMPSIAAIKAGSDLALANKETIVMAGGLVTRLAKENNVNIIPVDSEHSAIFHLLKAFTRNKERRKKDVISEIILTSSGGPFRNYSLKEMEGVTVKDALAHPTWNMGQKITIDSASMANKGLEVIEARSLFNIPLEKIKVVIHPQSIIHSMIRLCNGVIYAQASKPDMRHPIHDALYWPRVSPLNIDHLNFDSLSLEFHKPDLEKFPMLSYAFEAAKKGKLYTCAYNAANETAVSAFFERGIKFTDIPRITEQVLQLDWSGGDMDIEAVLKADTDARRNAVSIISNIKNL